jgi:hypothetical protein
MKKLTTACIHYPKATGKRPKTWLTGCHAIVSLVLLGISWFVVAGINPAGAQYASLQPTTLSEKSPSPSSLLSNPDWDGLSLLGFSIEALGGTWRCLAQLDWGKLSGQEILLFWAPRTSFKGANIRAYLAQGGLILFADDFGPSDSMLAALEIRRETETSRLAGYRYQANPALPIVQNFRSDPLFAGVGTIQTNHPAFFAWSRWENLAFFDVDSVADPRRPDTAAVFCIRGKIGLGQFVALADPSIFINQTMILADNFQFCWNILEYLGQNRLTPEFCFILPEAEEIGQWSERSGLAKARVTTVAKSDAALDPFARLNQQLVKWQQAARHQLVWPPALSVGLGLILSGLTWLLIRQHFRLTRARQPRSMPPPTSLSPFLAAVQAYLGEPAKQNYAALLLTLGQKFERDCGSYLRPNYRQHPLKSAWRLGFSHEYILIKRLGLVWASYQLIRLLANIPESRPAGASPGSFFISSQQLVAGYRRYLFIHGNLNHEKRTAEDI